MTDLGGVSFDKDAMYVQIKKHQLNFSDPASLLPDEKPEVSVRCVAVLVSTLCCSCPLHSHIFIVSLCIYFSLS
jgi:hypothetical protein